MADEVRIKVKTERLIEVSSDAKNQISRTKDAFERLNTLISNSTNFWDSKGGQKGRQYYQKEQERISQMLLDFNQHAANLLIIAGIYSEAETSAIAQTDLPKDIII